MGNRDAMMDAHDPKLLAVNRRTRTQTFKLKALTWKETASFNHTCLLTISWSVQGLPYFQHDIYHAQCFNTAVVSLFHLYFARLRQMRSARNIFFSLLNTFVTLSQFQLLFSFFYLAWPGCTQSAMWSPIWCCPMALTFPRCIPINFYFTLNNFPPFQLSLSVANFLHPCPSSLPQTVNFQCISFCLFPKYMLWNLHCWIWVYLYSSISWGHTSLSGVYSTPFLYWWYIPMFVTIEFQQHIPTFMPSSLMKILKKTGQKIDSCCHAIPSAVFFLFRTTLFSFLRAIVHSP